MIKLMKKIAIVLYILPVFFVSCSCKDITIPAERDFWVIDMGKNYETDSSAWDEVHGIRYGESSNAVVYVEDGQFGTTVTQSDVDAILAQFSSTIYPQITSHFAKPYDVDGNGKTYILLLDIQDGYTPGGAYVGGYYWPYDLISEKYAQKSNPLFHSNGADMLYVDINPQNVTLKQCWQTVAHEFQHLVNYSYHIEHHVVDENNYLVTLDTWIDEGLSEAASHMCYGPISDRIDYYNSDSAGYFRNGHPLFYWNTSEEDSNKVLCNYTLSYLYFQYLRSQSTLKEDIFRHVIRSGKGDYLAVEYAISKDSGLLSHGSSASDAFSKLLLRWYATNAGVSGSSKYGYDDITLTAPGEYIGTSATLQSGGGVYKGNISSTYTDTTPDGYIYLTVTNNGTTEDFDGTTYNNYDYLIAVNRTYSPDSTLSNDTDNLPVDVYQSSETDGTSQTALESASGLSRSDGSTKMYMIDMPMPRGKMRAPEADDED